MTHFMVAGLQWTCNYNCWLKSLFFHFFPACLREVKEVRQGKNSRDFDKWPEDSKKADGRICFIVFYGSDFKLKTLSVVGKTEGCVFVFLSRKGCDIFLIQQMAF